MQKLADIGVFGGSGFYEFIKRGKQVSVATPFGTPSAKLTIVSMFGKRVAFLPRHGIRHQFPAHMVPYRANIWAMHAIGVSRIIGPCAAGSLQANIKPGSFVIGDQFVDRTSGRKDTFFDGPELVHIQSVDTYCPQLRRHAIASCRKLKIAHHPKGTIVVIQGPRFSSASESAWFTKMGWEVINMTQYPEAILAHELGMCYVNVSLITDFDAGLVGTKGIKPVTNQEVMRVFSANLGKVKRLIETMIKDWPKGKTCACARASEEAHMH